MTKYKVPNLSSKTPHNEQTRLLDAVKAVQGVASAKLFPRSSELGITARHQQTPKHEDIESAVTNVGFPLASKI